MSQLPTGAVVFENVSKRYRLGALGTLRSTLASLTGRCGDSPRDFWALKDVSFRVEPGESLGLIGPNGAGKTTTLKLLSNITQPTSGRIEVSGRLSSLIELGAGFHPELSGRDNIFLNGAILGLKRREIQRKLDAIIAFSELERFIDTPVKRYSSGMYVRLGFAVAAHVEPDILLVDEVLAVGDASFRSRCIKRIRQMQTNGTTVILVSHNMHQIREVCASGILLMNGQIAERGTPSDVIAKYEQLMVARQPEPANDPRSAVDGLTTSRNAIHLSVDIKPSTTSSKYLSPRAPATACIKYTAPVPVPIGRIHVTTYGSDHTACCVADSAEVAGFVTKELARTGTIEVTYRPLQLAAGRYYIVVRVTDESDAEVIASCQSAIFSVTAACSGEKSGMFVPNVTWNTVEQSAEGTS